MSLFFSVARSQEIGSWERATETAQNSVVNTGNGNSQATGTDSATATPPAAPKPAVKVAVPKSGVNPNFGMNMPMMVSAFDTAVWLRAAA